MFSCLKTRCSWFGQLNLHSTAGRSPQVNPPLGFSERRSAKSVLECPAVRHKLQKYIQLENQVDMKNRTRYFANNLVMNTLYSNVKLPNTIIV